MSEAVTLLEDEAVSVKMPRQGYVAGHLIVVPKTDAMILEELEEAVLTKLLTLGNRLCGVLFEALECDGTNLFVQNGVAAGQVDDSVILHVIPRWEEDGLDFSWSKQKLGEAQLGQLEEQLSFAANNDAIPSGNGEARTVDSDDTEEVVEGADNYYAKQFKRGLR